MAEAFGNEIENLPQVVLAPLLYAIPLAGLSLAIAAFTRRAYATGAIIAVFIVTAAVSAILGEAVTDGPIGDLAQLINPFVPIDGTRDLLVGDPARDSPVSTGFPLYWFAIEWVLLAGHRRRGPVALPPGGRVSDAASVPAPSLEAPTVEVANASRWYGNVVAVNDVTFGLDGGITGLLGPNGAGKSTILHMIAGFPPSSGGVTVGGSPTRGHPELYRRIGLVPESEAVYPFLTGRQFVVANARLQGMSTEQAAAAAARAIDHVDLGAAQDQAIGTYSKGMRQRIKVASALVHDPPGCCWTSRSTAWTRASCR